MPYKVSNLGGVLQQQYEADPRLLMALQGMQAGGSTAPVYSAGEGIARALQAPLAAYTAKKLQGEYQGKRDEQFGAIADLLAPKVEAQSVKADLGPLGTLDASTPELANPNRDKIMSALQSGLLDSKAVAPSVAAALGFGTAAEYDTTPRTGINPATNKREQYVLDKQGNMKWLGVAPETKSEFVNGRAVDPFTVQPGYQVPDTMTPEAEAQKARIAAAGKPTTNIALNTEKTFAGNVASNMAKQFTDNRDKASAAAAGIQALQEARALLDQGIYTGQMADLQLLGAKLGMGDTSKIGSTEAFQAAMGRQTLALVKNLGAGSGISNADREYADKVAGGKITLNEESLRKIIDINERAQRGVIRGYNKEAGRVSGAPSMSSLPVDLMVNEPPAYVKSKTQSGIPSIASDDDYAKLPPGTVFVGPDGKKRRKP